MSVFYFAFFSLCCCGHFLICFALQQQQQQQLKTTTVKNILQSANARDFSPGVEWSDQTGTELA